VTLSLAALGFLGLPPALVEFGIAVSILVLALELARGEGGRPSWLRRAPWAMAGLFGLLHGFGFAGALAEVGLPQEEIPAALLSFNLGIELGQLAFVAAVLALRRALRPGLRRAPGWLSRAPVYAIGALASYWCFDRAFALLEGLGGFLL
jgi:hydrogenase/urease accessory protein HupE